MLDFASCSGCWFDDDRYYYIKPIHLRKFKTKFLQSFKFSAKFQENCDKVKRNKHIHVYRFN